MLPKHHSIQDKFSPYAKNLRKYFEEQFKDPRQTNSTRFQWDYWYIKNQYRFLRTPAQSFFPAPLYEAFVTQLISWGQKNLGCQGISPPWLSYYVDGCYQNLHCDNPHGPWAFVYSLSPSKKSFTGGETMMLKKSALNFDPTTQRKNPTHEFKELFEVIPSPFNRLTVFDPRFPHGVSRVTGAEDPMEARLVIHGWFTHPYPHTDTKSGASYSKNTIPHIFADIEYLTEYLGPVDGILVYELSIDTKGKVTQAKLIQNTLIGHELNRSTLNSFLKELELLIKKHSFGKNKSASKLTLPIPFQTTAYAK